MMKCICSVSNWVTAHYHSARDEGHLPLPGPCRSGCWGVNGEVISLRNTRRKSHCRFIQRRSVCFVCIGSPEEQPHYDQNSLILRPSQGGSFHKVLLGRAGWAMVM